MCASLHSRLSVSVVLVRVSAHAVEGVLGNMSVRMRIFELLNEKGVGRWVSVHYRHCVVADWQDLLLLVFSVTMFN